jgi:tetratricopeptide (TPR) repeat protein
MKASYQLPLAPLLLILLLVSTFARHARPPELLQARALTTYAQPRSAIDILEPLAQLTNANLASLYSAKASLARLVCDFHQTLQAYRLTIDILTRGYGPRSIMEGITYALRAQILDYTGDHSQAIADYRHALSLLKEAPGRYTPAYLTVQLAYCHSIRKAGLKQKALCLEKG